MPWKRYALPSLNISAVKVSYDSCDNCPLWLFIDVVTSGELHGLTPENWQKISDEYTELSRDRNSDSILALQRSICKLRNEAFIVEVVINQLAYGYDEQLCAILKRLGIRARITADNIEQTLEYAKTEAKSIVVQLQQREKELKQFAGGKAATKRDFDAKLAALSKHMGFRIDKNISVSEYVSYKNDFDMYLEQLEKQTNGRSS